MQLTATNTTPTTVIQKFLKNEFQTLQSNKDSSSSNKKNPFSLLAVNPTPTRTRTRTRTVVPPSNTVTASNTKTILCTMGNKTYFEFLEEEFQILASQLQNNLAGIASDDRYDSPDAPEAVTKAGKQLARCQAVLQQLLAECRKDSDFKDRAALYKIQIGALKQEYDRHR
mmetsp:Transcript_15531/g.31918  ORF Transcript_15531/g.31918 Transcript_15531/m.31918 type:complete len:170 (-) Transcript_15531:171-680(-)